MDARLHLVHTQSVNADACALALAEVHLHPELWDVNPMRTAQPDSPHREVSDIWLRYAADPSATGPHESVWWEAAYSLPQCAQLAEAVAAELSGNLHSLRGVLITRIPPGGVVYRHTDEGWHAASTRKIGVQITSAFGQAFCMDGVELVTLPGEAFEFDNSNHHWVVNVSDDERITMIVCIARDEGESCLGEQQQQQ